MSSARQDEIAAALQPPPFHTAKQSSAVHGMASMRVSAEQSLMEPLQNVIGVAQRDANFHKDVDPMMVVRLVSMSTSADAEEGSPTVASDCTMYLVASNTHCDAKEETQLFNYQAPKNDVERTHDNSRFSIGSRIAVDSLTDGKGDGMSIVRRRNEVNDPREKPSLMLQKYGKQTTDRHGGGTIGSLAVEVFQFTNGALGCVPAGTKPPRSRVYDQSTEEYAFNFMRFLGGTPLYAMGNPAGAGAKLKAVLDVIHEDLEVLENDEFFAMLTFPVQNVLRKATVEGFESPTILMGDKPLADMFADYLLPQSSAIAKHRDLSIGRLRIKVEGELVDLHRNSWDTELNPFRTCSPREEVELKKKGIKPGKPYAFPDGVGACKYVKTVDLPGGNGFDMEVVRINTPGDRDSARVCFYSPTGQAIGSANAFQQGTFAACEQGMTSPFSAELMNAKCVLWDKHAVSKDRIGDGKALSADMSGWLKGGEGQELTLNDEYVAKVVKTVSILMVMKGAEVGRARHKDLLFGLALRRTVINIRFHKPQPVREDKTQVRLCNNSEGICAASTLRAVNNTLIYTAIDVQHREALGWEQQNDEAVKAAETERLRLEDEARKEKEARAEADRLAEKQRRMKHHNDVRVHNMAHGVFILTGKKTLSGTWEHAKGGKVQVKEGRSGTGVRVGLVDALEALGQLKAGTFTPPGGKGHGMYFGFRKGAQGDFNDYIDQVANPPLQNHVGVGSVAPTDDGTSMPAPPAKKQRTRSELGVSTGDDPSRAGEDLVDGLSSPSKKPEELESVDDDEEMPDGEWFEYTPEEGGLQYDVPRGADAAGRAFAEQVKKDTYKGKLKKVEPWLEAVIYSIESADNLRYSVGTGRDKKQYTLRIDPVVIKDNVKVQLDPILGELPEDAPEDPADIVIVNVNGRMFATPPRTGMAGSDLYDYSVYAIAQEVVSAYVKHVYDKPKSLAHTSTVAMLMGRLLRLFPDSAK